MCTFLREYEGINGLLISAKITFGKIWFLSYCLKITRSVRSRIL